MVRQQLGRACLFYVAIACSSFNISQIERKSKYFQFTPRSQSCKLIEHWGEITRAGRIVDFDTGRRYPFENIMCPVALFHGDQDYMARCGEVEQEIRRTCATTRAPRKGLLTHWPLYRSPDMIRHVEVVEGFEHLDLIWAEDSPERVFEPLVRVLSELEH